VTAPSPATDTRGAALRVLLIDDGAHRVAVIRDELTRQGHLVVGVVDQALLIHDCVLRLQPDVVIVDAESPSRDTLENLATMSSTSPRPVVVFAEDASHEPMQQALKAGVSAYVIAGLDPTAPDAGAAGGHRPLRAGPRAARPARRRRRRSCRSAS
jgi:response regulator NasT